MDSCPLVAEDRRPLAAEDRRPLAAEDSCPPGVVGRRLGFGCTVGPSLALVRIPLQQKCGCRGLVIPIEDQLFRKSLLNT